MHAQANFLKDNEDIFENAYILYNATAVSIERRNTANDCEVVFVRCGMI